jgi:calcineurin-like phosphoesterase family protein
MNYWITTDTHLGHDNIAKYCDRPDDYNERIINGLSVLNYDDVLIHLGDVAFTGDGERKYLGNIPCKKWLILGNHDKSLTYHLKIGWDWVGEEMSLRRYGKLIRFSHKPVPISEEDIQFHGHFHNAPPEYWEGWLKSIMTSKHHLLVLEYMSYQPATLESLVKAIDNS